MQRESSFELPPPVSTAKRRQQQVVGTAAGGNTPDAEHEAGGMPAHSSPPAATNSASSALPQTAQTAREPSGNAEPQEHAGGDAHTHLSPHDTAAAFHSTHAVNTAYSRRLVVGGDRALVVHFTHNPNQNLAPAEQLLSMARVAIPAICNYLYFRAGRVAVVYFGKTRNASGLKVGIVGGEDMKSRLLRYLTVEIWPPLRTDVPDDSGEHATPAAPPAAEGDPEGAEDGIATTGGGMVGGDTSGSGAPVIGASVQSEGTDRLDEAAVAEAQPVSSADASPANTFDSSPGARTSTPPPMEPTHDPMSPAGPLATAAVSWTRRGARPSASSSPTGDEYLSERQRRRRQAAAIAAGESSEGTSTDPATANDPAAAAKDSQTDDTRGHHPVTVTAAVKRVVLTIPASEGGRGMQVLVYLKPGAGGTHYLKLVLSNIERVHFDVVDTREEKHRWENRKLHIRMLDSLETQKAIFSYAEYENALRDACTFSVDHRDDDAEAIIAECDEVTRAAANGPTTALGVSAPEDPAGGGESPAMGPAMSPLTEPGDALPKGGTFAERLATYLGNATTPLLYAMRSASLNASTGGSRPPTPAMGSGRSPAAASAHAPDTPGASGFTLGPSASHDAPVTSPTQSSGSGGPYPEPGRVHCVVVKDHYYQFYQPMHLPESATLDYKSYFFNTAKEIQDRAVKFMCGFLNAYGHGKLVVGVHEIRGAISHCDSAASKKSGGSAADARLANMPRDGRVNRVQQEVERELAKGNNVSSPASATPSSSTGGGRPEPDQLVVGASLAAEQVATLVNDLSVQLIHCVPPIPPEIVHINLVPVRVPEVRVPPPKSPAVAGAAASPTVEGELAALSMGSRAASLLTPPHASAPNTAAPTAVGSDTATGGGRTGVATGSKAAGGGLFPDVAASVPPAMPAAGGAGGSAGATIESQLRQRVLIFYEPPAANWWHTFQQKANFAVRVLARFGFSLVPIDLPVPRLQPPPPYEPLPPRQVIEAPTPLAHRSHRQSIVDLNALDGDDQPATVTTDDTVAGDGRVGPAAAGEAGGTSPSGQHQRTPGKSDWGLPPAPATGPLAGAIHPIPHDWYAQCYSIVPFAPSAQAKATIFATETQQQKDATTTAATGSKSESTVLESGGGTRGEMGSSDVVEVIDSSGNWTPYDEHNSRIVSAAKGRGDKVVSVRMGKRQYSIDLQTMIQRNVKTNKNRQLRLRHFGGITSASADGTTLADHEVEVMRGLSLQKTKRQCIVWADGVALPELFIIDVSVDLRRLPDAHPLRNYRGKFFNGWPSIPLWDPLSHCVRRAPRNYHLVLQRRHTLAGLLPNAPTEWHQIADICAVVTSFACHSTRVALRLTTRHFEDAVDTALGRDVVRAMCDDATALMRDAVVAVPFDALRAAQAALRREYGHPSHGGAAQAASVMAQRYLAHRLAQQGIVTGQQATLPPVGGSRRAQRRAKRHMLQPPRGPGVLPLLLCWVYESIGALPAPYPHVPVPLQLQHVRVAPNLITLLMMPSAEHAHWSLVPSIVLDLNDGLVKFFLPEAYNVVAQPTTHVDPSAAAMGVSGTAAGGMGSRVGSSMSTGSLNSAGSPTPQVVLSGSTEHLLAALRVVCGAVCDAHSAALQLMYRTQGGSSGAGSAMGSRSGTGLLFPTPTTGPARPSSSSHHHHYGRRSGTSVMPIPLIFVDSTVAIRDEPWRLESLLVWLQLVAKDPQVRHHGAPASGSTMAYLCDLAFEACNHHVTTPAVQTKMPVNTSAPAAVPHAGGGHALHGGSAVSSFAPSPQPTGAAGGSGGQFPAAAAGSASSMVPTSSSESGPTAAAAETTARPDSMSASVLGRAAAAPVGLSLTPSSPPSMIPRTPTTPTAALGGSQRAAGVGGGRRGAAAGEFPSAPEFHVSLQTRPSPLRPPAQASGVGRDMPSPATMNSLTNFATCFDCPMHRAEAEWAMW